METAEILFAEKGFNGTSVRDIAEKAHVNLAMISYYFGSKDKLLESLFDYRGEHLKLKLESMIQDKALGSFENPAVFRTQRDRRIRFYCSEILIPLRLAANPRPASAL